MKKIVLILLSAIYLYSIEITLNSGREAGKNFAVLNIEKETPFTCKEIVEDGRVSLVRCLFEKAPPYKLTRSRNAFFDIEFKNIEDMFAIEISLKQESLLIPIPFSLEGDMVGYETDEMSAKRWQIISYEDKLPFIQKSKSAGINFPIEITNYKYPTVGALDFRGEPINFEAGPDVDEYLVIKNLMESEQYELAIMQIDDVLDDYPQTVFRSDLELFKIRAMYELGDKADKESLIEFAKRWIRENAAENSASEVLLIIADTYASMGFYDEANYYFDRIFFEHKGEKYEKLAKIALGDTFANRDNAQKAYELYNEALFETDDVGVASLAAFRLGSMMLDAKEYSSAKDSFEKILSANPKFFKQKFDQSSNIAESFAEAGEYGIAAKIAEALYENTKRTNPHYETLGIKKARWFDEAGENKKALQAYREYLDTFTNGAFVDEARKGIDSLFIKDADDSNRSLDEMNKIVDEYPQSSEIYKQALLQKAKILLNEQKYEDVLDMDDKLRDFNSSKPILDDAATTLAREAAKKRDCDQLFYYIIEYNLDIKSLDVDRVAFECGMKLGFFDRVKDVPQTHLNDKKLEDRLFWMNAYAEVLFKEDKINLFLDVANDLLTLSNDMDIDSYNAIYFKMLKAYIEQNNQDMVLSTIENIEQHFSSDSRMLEAYKSVADFLNSKNQKQAALSYYKKLQTLQQNLNRYPYSPELTLSIMDIYSSQKNNQELIKASEDIKNLDKANEAKYYYLLGSAYQNLNDNQNAIDSFDACIDAKSDSPYEQLCAELKGLIE
ncbi:MAG: tetratricopeptide repeat protein [Campylobacterales bacterium]